MASTRESQPFRDAGDGFRLRPSRKRAPRDRPPHQIVQTWARVMRAVAGGNANQSARRSDGSAPRPHSAHRQRCAVRLTYSPNRVAGHFAAHARYLLRDSAAGPDVIHGSIGETPLAEAMGQWQSAGDKRVFKVILSPEFGERIDLGKLASEFIQRIERGTPPLQAAIEGTSRIAFTVIAISLSLVAAFVPLFFMGGIVGKFFQEFSFIVSFG